MGNVNRTVILVVTILAVAILAALYIKYSQDRFYVTRGPKGLAYEVDRRTGQSWMLYGARKVPQQGGTETHRKEQELPPFEAAKVTGNAGLDSVGFFSGKLYNGSDWTVTRVIITVSAKENNGTVRWTRDLAVSKTIEPLTTEDFTVEITGESGIKEAPWNIKDVFGYRK